MSYLALALALGLTAFQPVPVELTDVERAALTEEIEQEAQGFLDALVARDIERWSGLLQREGFEMVTQGGIRDSYEAVRSSFARRFAEEWARAEGTWTDTRVRVLAADAAVFRGITRVVIESPSGGTRTFPAIFFTLVYQRGEDGWKVGSIHESFSSNSIVTTPPPSEGVPKSGGR